VPFFTPKDEIIGIALNALIRKHIKTKMRHFLKPSLQKPFLHSACLPGSPHKKIA
jgi:hypothetical protein